jgi:hypothetical protein
MEGISVATRAAFTDPIASEETVSVEDDVSMGSRCMRQFDVGNNGGRLTMLHRRDCENGVKALLFSDTSRHGRPRAGDAFRSQKSNSKKRSVCIERLP